MEPEFTETFRRTFNINNFESMTIEGTGHDDDRKRAHLLAIKDCLTKAQAEMVRIFNIRQQHGLAQEFDNIAYSMVTSEIQGIDSELET